MYPTQHLTVDQPNIRPSATCTLHSTSLWTSLTSDPQLHVLEQHLTVDQPNIRPSATCTLHSTSLWTSPTSDPQLHAPYTAPHCGPAQHQTLSYMYPTQHLTVDQPNIRPSATCTRTAPHCGPAQHQTLSYMYPTQHLTVDQPNIRPSATCTLHSTSLWTSLTSDPQLHVLYTAPHCGPA